MEETDDFEGGLLAGKHARVTATLWPLKGRRGAEPFGWGALRLNADLRSPGQHEIFKVHNSMGRSRVVIGRSECIISRSVDGLPSPYGQWVEMVTHEC